MVSPHATQIDVTPTRVLRGLQPVSTNLPTSTGSKSGISPISKPSADLSLRFRLWLCCCCVLLVVLPITAYFVGVRLGDRGFRGATSGDVATSDSNRTVLVIVDLVAIDTKAGTILLDWTIIRDTGCTGGGPSCETVDIFFDSNLIRADGNSDETRTNGLPTKPTFQYNQTASSDVYSNIASFRTSIAIFSSSFNPRSSSLYYPFDQYIALLFAFARTSVSNETVSIEIIETQGAVIGYSTTVIRTLNDTPDGPMDFLQVSIDISRDALTKFYSVVIVVVIWVITMILMLVMVTAVCFGYKQKGEVLLVPAGVLFAFTQLRGSMPGVPQDFGAIIDFCGLFPCLAILAFSAALSLGAFVFYDPTDAGREPDLRPEMSSLFKAVCCCCCRRPKKRQESHQNSERQDNSQTLSAPGLLYEPLPPRLGQINGAV